MFPNPATRPGGPRAVLIIAIITTILGGLISPAAAQVRVVTWNIAKLNGNLADLEDVLIELHADDSHGFAVPVGVFVFQEVEQGNQNTLLSLINATAPAGSSYSLATYTNFGEDPIGGAQAMFYRADLVSEDASEHADIFTPGLARRVDRWKLDLKVDNFTFYDSPAAHLWVYGMHLKAGTSTADMDTREDGAIAVRNDADTLGTGQNIIYAGDMNFANHNEAGYLEFFDAGNGAAIDPLGTGVSWTGSGNAIKHTQAPCNTGCSLIGGGMDDRFDFQLITLELNDGDGIAIIPGTYRAFGNDGMHFNQSINNNNNFYFPGDIPRSNALADDLRDASDHIPVVVDFQIPAVLDLIVQTSTGRVIQDAVVDVFMLIQNDAPVVVASGADDLEYTAFGTGDIGGVFIDTAAPLAGFNNHLFPVDTSTVGPISGTLATIATGEAVHNGNTSTPISGDVVRSANPSFDDVTDTDALLVEDTLSPDSGSQPLIIDVHNFGFDSDQALLDVDNITGDAAPFSIVDGAAADIGAAPDTIELAVDTTGLAPGLYEAILTINTSDEDLPGETLHTLDLTWRVTISGDAAPCPWDCAPQPDGNGTVNFDDLIQVVNAISTQDLACDVAPDNGDGTFGNGVITFDDLIAIINNFGDCP